MSTPRNKWLRIAQAASTTGMFVGPHPTPTCAHRVDSRGDGSKTRGSFPNAPAMNRDDPKGGVTNDRSITFGSELKAFPLPNPFEQYGSDKTDPTKDGPF